MNEYLGMGIGAAANLLTNAFGQNQQLRQQEKLMGMQIKGAKEMADYNRELQMKTWHDTNYSAQVGEMNKAGINPGLLYGMGGGGGTTTGSPGGAMPTTATAEGPSTLSKGMMEMSLLTSQKKLLDAQAAKAEAEANKTKGVDTEKATTEIQNLTQGIENAKAIQQLTKAQTFMQQLDNQFQYKTFDDRQKFIEFNTDKALQQVLQAENETFISNKTIQEKISIIQQAAIEAQLKNLNLNKDIQVKDAELKQIAQKINESIANVYQGWEKLNQTERQTRVQEFQANFKAEHPGLLEVLGKNSNRVIEGTLELINKIRGAKDKWRFYEPEKVN